MADKITSVKRVGDGTPGPGRPKGAINKTTASMKAAFIEAFDRRGGVGGLMSWAESNPDDFYKLCGRIIPMDVSHSGDLNIVVKTGVPRSDGD